MLKALNLTRPDATRLMTESPDRLLEAVEHGRREKRSTCLSTGSRRQVHAPSNLVAACSGRKRDIPMIIGTNSDEAAAFLRDMREPLADDGAIRSRLKRPSSRFPCPISNSAITHELSQSAAEGDPIGVGSRDGDGP